MVTETVKLKYLYLVSMIAADITYGWERGADQSEWVP